jgi:biopolymer transport protein ExbD
MAFAGLKSVDKDAPLAEINMLLLVIFIVAVRLLTRAPTVGLYKASSLAKLTKPDNVQLGINAGGQVYWNGEPAAP